eukprot:TRINITY_DN6837_c0_g1_i4.p1 TRINITY_DN6837_c0_g1~~TRINITY_DN6837_c0_g1_i4.p1  ORF type:complete len:1730 (+),score=280.15 TRINITY_DN6837_c0_g1_i4:424-5613(+)
MVYALQAYDAAIIGGGREIFNLWSMSSWKSVRVADSRHVARALICMKQDHNVWTACDDGAVRIYDLESGELQHVLHGHAGYLLAMVAANGTVWTAGADGRICIWDAHTYQCRRQLGGHTGSVNSLLYLQKADRVVSGGTDTSLRIWDCVTLQCIAVVAGHRAPIMTIAEVGETLWVGDTECTTIWTEQNLLSFGDSTVCPPVETDDLATVSSSLHPLSQLSVLLNTDNVAIKQQAVTALSGVPGTIEYLLSVIKSSNSEQVLCALDVLVVLFTHNPSLSVSSHGIAEEIATVLGSPASSQAIMAAAARVVCASATVEQNALELQNIVLPSLLDILATRSIRPVTFCAVTQAVAAICSSLDQTLLEGVILPQLSEWCALDGQTALKREAFQAMRCLIAHEMVLPKVFNLGLLNTAIRAIDTGARFSQVNVAASFIVVHMLQFVLTGACDANSLHELVALSRNVHSADQLMASGAFSIVLQILGSANSTIAFDALRVCANIAAMSEHQLVLIQLGAIEAVLGLAAMTDPHIRAHVAGTLANLSLDKSGLSIARMLQVGAADTLISLLRADESEVQGSACLAITNFLCVADGNNRRIVVRRFVEAGAVELLAERVLHNDDAVSLNALRGLLQFSLLEEVVPRILHVLFVSSPSDTFEIASNKSQLYKLHSVVLLASLTKTAEGAATVVQHGYLEPLMLLLDSDTPMCEAVVRTLSHISRQPCHTQGLVSVGVLDRMTSLLYHASHRVQQDALTMLINFSAQPSALKRIVELGLMQPLTDLVLSSVTRIQVDSTALMGSLLRSQFLPTAQLLQAMGPLVAVLFLGELRARQNAAVALTYLASINDEWKLRLVDSGSVIGLLKLLAESDVHVKRQAAIAIELFCKMIDASSRFANTAFHALLQCLQTCKDIATIRAVSNSLSYLCRIMPVRVLLRMKAIEPLVVQASHEDPGTAANVLLCLAYIARGDEARWPLVAANVVDVALRVCTASNVHKDAYCYALRILSGIAMSERCVVQHHALDCALPVLLEAASAPQHDRIRSVVLQAVTSLVHLQEEAADSLAEITDKLLEISRTVEVESGIRASCATLVASAASKSSTTREALVCSSAFLPAADSLFVDSDPALVAAGAYLLATGASDPSVRALLLADAPRLRLLWSYGRPEAESVAPHVACCLHLLSEVPTCESQFLITDAIHCALDLSHSPVTAVRRSAVSALANMMMLKALRTASVGVLDRAVALLNDPDEELRVQSLRIVASISGDSAERAKLSTLGISTIACREAATSSVRLQQFACGLIANLALDSECHAQLLNADVVVTVVLLLSSPDSEVRRAAALAVANLASHSHHSSGFEGTDAKFLSAGVLPALLDCLRCSDVGVQAMALTALAAIRDPEAHEAMMDVAWYAELTRLAGSQDDTTASQALHVFVQLLRDEQHASTLVARGLIDCLASIIATTSFSVLLAVCATASGLVSHFPLHERLRAASVLPLFAQLLKIDDARVQYRVLKCLVQMSGLAEARKEIALAMFLPSVTTLLIAHDPAVAAASVELIASLSSDKVCVRAVLDTGSFGAILALLMLSPREDAQHFAALTVLHIASHEEYRNYVTQCGGIMPLVRALMSQSFNARLTSVRALAAIALDEAAACIIAQTGAVALLVNLLHLDDKVLHPVLLCLSRLCSHSSCIVAVSAAGVKVVAQKLLDDPAVALETHQLCRSLVGYLPDLAGPDSKSAPPLEILP